MKFYILKLFLNSGEDFQNIFHFKFFFFEMKYILKLSSPEWKKFQNVKFHFHFPRFDKTVNYTFQNEKERLRFSGEKYLPPKK